MMKYFSLLLILIAMRWSWGFVRTEPMVPERIHIGIQQDLEQVIRDYVMQNRPSAKEVEFTRFYTESLSPSKVKARFTYSFADLTEDDSEARVEIDGFAILNKTDKETEEAEFWSFDELYILNNKIDFTQELKISPGDTE